MEGLGNIDINYPNYMDNTAKPSYLVNYTGSASNGVKDLLGAQWQNYLDNYVPIENEAINFAMTDEPVKESLANVRKSINRGFNNSETGFNQSLSGYGISETARQRAARMKKQDIQKGSTMTQGLNDTRRHVQDLQSQVLAGDMGIKTLDQE